MDQGETDDLSGLLHRCAAGDRVAFRQIYVRHAPRLKGLALRITGSQAQAEDVVHDVFLTIWREAHRFDATRGSGIGWLVMMTRFGALELVRGNGRARQAGELPDWRGHLPDALDMAMSQAARRSLHDCLAQLPPDGRDAILRAFIDGLTHVEIATAANMPLGTLKSLIRRSLRSLKKCMDG